jgi:hypothetical protein
MNELMNLNIDVIKGKKAGSVYVGRPSVLGNRFEMDKNGIKKDGNRAEVIEKFRLELWEDFKIKGKKYKECVRLAKLAKGGTNLRLSCWCSPLACHGDVIKNAVKWLIESGVV